ncbi:hypothetical protein [Nostoc sp.]
MDLILAIALPVAVGIAAGLRVCQELLSSQFCYLTINYKQIN